MKKSRSKKPGARSQKSPRVVEAQLFICPRGHIELVTQASQEAECAAGLEVIRRCCPYPQCGCSTDLESVTWGTWFAAPILEKRGGKQCINLDKLEAR